MFKQFIIGDETMNKTILLLILSPLLFIEANAKMVISNKVALGKALYSDESLSENRTMSCATCHHKKTAFVDIRESPINHMAAFSADGAFIGDRNVPTASYAAFIPKFHTKIDEDTDEILFVGGQFWDGRATDLKAQAKGPFLNPIEMQMPNEEAVIERIKENNAYIQAFQKFYGNDIFDDVNKSYDALADAIATFEKSKVFSPFDSKYDRYISGKVKLTKQEKKGLALFSDEKRANCVACHTLETHKHQPALFTDFTYDNLGVPVNRELRAINGKDEDFIDHGLLDNPNVHDNRQDGKFRVSTLRNIAVTAPYMHNGVFKELKTVVHFYNTRDVEGAINPETGEPWEKAEIESTVNHEELGDLGLSDKEEDAIVAFLKTLTDKRYE